MKLLFDFFPILLFFVVYKFAGIYAATVTAMVAALVQTVYFRVKHHRFEPMHLFSLVIIVVLGGATLYLQNELFIKWKPTVLNWIFALAFFTSQYLGKQPLIQRLLAKNVELPAMIWSRLNLLWAVFFAVLGALNLYIVYHFSTDIWVNFKLFGMLGLTILFVIAQSIYLASHIKEPMSH
jgi:intracellular septation protein